MSLKAVKPAFILTVKVYIAPENVQEFRGQLQPVYDKVLAEPECLYFLFGEKQGEDGVFQWTEGWAKGPEWFMKEQVTKDYYKPYLAATEPLFIKPREFEIYTPVESMMNFKTG